MPRRTSPRRSSRNNSLRQKAEKLLSKSTEAISKLPAEDLKELIHELNVYEIELEMQNEQLRRIESQLKESENRYRELSANLLNAYEKERKRIALEVHDSTGASLATSKIELEAALKEMSDDNSPAKVVLERVIAIIERVMEDTRRIQMFIRPPMLDDLGILATINWFCREFESAYPKIRIRKEIDIQEQEVPQSLKTVIYRVLLEALGNVAKHSKASVALLYLRKAKKSIELVIRDTGHGFDLEEAYSRKGADKGLGLDRMREKTHLSGGVFRIESSKGAGTVIKATWPIEQPSS